MESRDIDLIRVLQKEEIFLTESPFKEAARLLGWGLDEVLEGVRRLKEAGAIRRFGAALTPRNAGFKANAMVVWQANGSAMSAAESMASHQRVSHCYIRPSFEGFPYNVYTMLHGNSPEDLKKIIAELSAVSGIKEFRALTSVHEYKKSSPVYFPQARRAD